MKKILFKNKKEQLDTEYVPQKDGFEDFMKKEIFIQPALVDSFLNKYTNSGKILPNLYKINTEKIKRIYIVCDMANYGCAVFGAYNFEVIADLICVPVILSEFNCANPILDKNTLVVIMGDNDAMAVSFAVGRISKCGARLMIIGEKKAEGKLKNYFVTGLKQIGTVPTAVNTINSIFLAMLSLYFGKKEHIITDLYFEIAASKLFDLNSRIKSILEYDYILNELSKNIISCDEVVFTGKNTDFTCAVYGEFMAQRLCGINARAIPSGELGCVNANRAKIIAFISSRELMMVVLSEISKYKDRTILIVPENLLNSISGFEQVITYNGSIPLYNPIIGNVITQLLFYNCAKNKSLPTDRN